MTSSKMPEREREEGAISSSTVICNQRGEWVAVGLGPGELTITAAGSNAASNQPTLQERAERAGTLVVAFLDLFLGAEPPRRAAYSKDGSLPKDRPPSPRPYRQAVFARPALMQGDQRAPQAIRQAGLSSRSLSAAPYNLPGSAQNSALASGAEGSSSAAPVACYVY